jgi:tyrosine-protein kinase Etk/Wzc
MSLDPNAPGANPHSAAASTLPVAAEYQILDLGAVLRVFLARRFTIVGWAVAGAVAAWLIAFLIHPKFDATVRLMAPPQKQSLLATLTPTRNEGDLYLGLMSSRTVADDVIERQHLADYFHTTKPSELRRDLDRISKITVDKDQFVTVTVRCQEPETALRIANEYPDALYRLNHDIAVAQATHRFEYYKGPLQAETAQLAAAEEDLKRAQQQTGVVLPQAQVQLGLSSISSLEQQITLRREQLAGLEAGSTAQNPNVVALRSQIGSLEGQLQRLKTETGGSGAGIKANEALPERTLEVTRKEREVKFHEALFEVLSKQYENARLEDSYAAPVELVDRAVLPDEKSWPSRSLFALCGFFAGAFLAMGLIWRRR